MNMIEHYFAFEINMRNIDDKIMVSKLIEFKVG